ASDMGSEPDASAKAAPVPKAPPPPKAAESPPPPAETKEAPPSAGPSDLAKLRADYDRLRDELYRARARAQIVQEGLYASRLAATVRWKGSPDYVMPRAAVPRRGGSLGHSGKKPITDDLIKVAERPVKP